MTVMVRMPTWSAVTAAGMIAFASPVAAQDEPAIGPTAENILRQMSEELSAATEFSFRAEAVDAFSVDFGLRLQLEEAVRINVRRPGLVRVDLSSDDRKKTAWIGSDTFTLLHRNENMYARTRVSGGLAEVITHVETKYGVDLPLSDFVTDDPYSSLTEGMTVGYYSGIYMARGVPCHHVVLLGDDVNLQLWIEEDVRMLPRKIAISYKNQSRSPEYVAFLTDWDFSPSTPPSVLEFRPPADAIEIEMLPGTFVDSGVEGDAR